MVVLGLREPWGKTGRQGAGGGGEDGREMKRGNLAEGGENSGRGWSCEGKAPAGVSKPGICSQIAH